MATFGQSFLASSVLFVIQNVAQSLIIIISCFEIKTFAPTLYPIWTFFTRKHAILTNVVVVLFVQEGFGFRGEIMTTKGYYTDTLLSFRFCRDTVAQLVERPSQVPAWCNSTTDSNHA